ncbi:SRPBCC family protein [Streptomyces justiciae]|uniref:SRPBCC family protein n=1 Tax=Streptomyces justiciae TaxID=2780140 RepID=UPI0021189D32|nr:SRPBCC family protein [Streptomyces justiciae]MCW8383846.1 SRPBCC family protein [Streptomyces justiciae]
MPPLTVTVTSRSSASADVVYAALLDAQSWPSWTSYHEVDMEPPAGVERPVRAGDRRTVRNRRGGVICREQLVDLVPGQRFGYEQASGPLWSHHGAVILTRAPDGGTEITWSARYRHTVPLLDPFRKRHLQILSDDLAAYANSMVNRHS